MLLLLAMISRVLSAALTVIPASLIVTVTGVLLIAQIKTYKLIYFYIFLDNFQ